MFLRFLYQRAFRGHSSFKSSLTKLVADGSAVDHRDLFIRNREREGENKIDREIQAGKLEEKRERKERIYWKEKGM